MIRTFRPWTHTSDDSYIYQLSLVVATATVSLIISIYTAVMYVVLLYVVTVLFQETIWAPFRRESARKLIPGAVISCCVVPGI